MRRWTGMWAALVLLFSTIAPLHAEPMGAEETLFSEMPVVVTVSKKEEPVLTAPGTVYVFTDKDIERWGWRDLKDILAAVPNMDFKNDYNWLQGGQRGFTGSFNGTLLLIDGREVQNLLADEAFIHGGYPASRIKRVEVLQGPNSTLYGANAMQGVINIITKTGDGQADAGEVWAMAGDAGTEQASVVLRRNDLGTGTSFGASATAYKSDRDWRKLREFTADDTRYSRSPRDPYRTHDPNEFYNTEKAQTFDVHVRHKRVYAGLNRTENKSLNGLESVEYDYRFAPTERSSTLYYAGVDGRVGDSLKLMMEYRHMKEGLELMSAGVVPGLDPAKDGPIPGVNNYADMKALPHYFAPLTFPMDRHQWYGQANFRLNGWVNLVSGFDYRMFYYRPGYSAVSQLRVVPEFDPPYSATDRVKQRERAFFLEDTASTPGERLKLTVGIMYHEKDYVDPSWLPRASLGWMVGEGSVLKATYGKGFRAPDGFERAQGLKAGYNPPPTEMDMVELNFTHSRRVRNGLFTNILSAYNMQAENIFVPVASFAGGGAYEGKFKVNGVEDMARLSSGRLEAFAGARYVRPDKTRAAGQDIVAYVPATKFKLGASWDFSRAVTSVFFDRWGRTKTEANTADMTGKEVLIVPSWWVMNANVIWRLSELLDFSLYVENVFDKTYYHVNNRATDPFVSPVQFMQPPRSFRATAKMKF